MNKLNSHSFNYEGISLTDILTFSTKYTEGISDVWAKIVQLAKGQTKAGVELTFLRADGTQKTERATITNIRNNEKRFDFGNYVDDGNNGKVFTGRTIRLDNVLGEIPVLLGFSYSSIFCFGKKIEAYRTFMEKVWFGGYDNNYVRLTYINTDGSFSSIDCLTKKVNKSNFETVDYRELRIINAKTAGVTMKGVNGRPDVHRFVSANGYLCKIELIAKPSYSHEDDGFEFGQTG